MVEDPEVFGGMMAYLEARNAVEAEVRGESQLGLDALKDKSPRGKAKVTRKKERVMRDHDINMAGAHVALAKKFPHLMKGR